MDDYKYRQLEDTDYIRIIVFSRTTVDDEVSFTLEHVSLAEAGEFDALSYCWGSAARDQEVLSDGAILKVTANLLSALQHLSRSKEVQRLWADAICINQEDRNEKSRQIPQMGEIYKTARRTIVWLGDGCDGRKAAIQHVKEFEISHEKDNLIRREDLKLIKPIFRNLWFTRLWVVQEVVLAKQVVISIGEDFVLWEPFCELISMLHDLASRNLWKISLHARGAILNLQAVRLMRVSIHEGVHNSMWLVLNATELFRVSDKRDRLYALYGLFEDAEFPVNYSDDYGHVEMFKDFAMWTFRKYANLDILSIARSNATICECAGPSWAPCFDTQRPVLLLLNVPHFDASGSDLNFYIRDEEELCVVGAFVDFIDAVDGDYECTYDVDELHRRALELAALAGCPGLSGNRYRKLCAAFILELERTGAKATENNINDVDEFLTRGSTVDNQHLAETCNKWQQDRCPCLTAGDRFAWASMNGWAPPEPGDRICILQGGRVPYLLRPETDSESDVKYTLIGECWIQGLMHGEALDLPEYKTETIVLV